MITCSRASKIIALMRCPQFREVDYQKGGGVANGYTAPSAGHIIIHHGTGSTQRNGWVGQVRQVTISDEPRIAQTYPNGAAEVCWMLNKDGGRIEYINQVYPLDWLRDNCTLAMLEGCGLYYLPSPHGNITSDTLAAEKKAANEKKRLEEENNTMSQGTVEAAPLTGKKNHIIWCQDPKSPNPTMVHMSQVDAENEALRLSKVHGKVFYVAKIVSKVEVEFIPQTSLKRM